MTITEFLFWYLAGIAVGLVLALIIQKMGEIK